MKELLFRKPQFFYRKKTEFINLTNFFKNWTSKGNIKIDFTWKELSKTETLINATSFARITSPSLPKWVPIKPS